MSQSRTGSPGHLAIETLARKAEKRTVSIPNGKPRPFSRGAISLLQSNNWASQSRTGSPGHLADKKDGIRIRFIRKSQSRTGSPGHLATVYKHWWHQIFHVSIPNGKPRPFSRGDSMSRYSTQRRVSIPNGKPRPFSPGIAITPTFNKI